jgi:Photosynthetic reaction centre cytochrome C subunit
MRLIRVSVGIGAFILTASVAGLFAQAPPQGGAAQGGAGGRAGQPPAAPQNLQVMPKDVSREQLLATMRGFTAGLGVQCNYCHVQEGRGGRNDLASDEKAPKKTARVMMKMMATVNDTLASGLGKTPADITKVECVTCHRGEAIPKNPPPPPPPAAAPGAGAAPAPGQ